MAKTTKSILLTMALVLCWGGFAGVGLLALQAYSARPGDAGAPPGIWPQASAIPISQRPWSLLVFLDLGCPCTSASLGELERLLAHSGDRLSLILVLDDSAGDRAGDANSSELLRLSQLPGVVTVHDQDGSEIRRFGMKTSGHSLLYHTAGTLVYSGGLTASRGHQGGNYGCDAVLAWVEGRDPGISGCPVFGCQLGGASRPAERSP